MAIFGTHSDQTSKPLNAFGALTMLCFLAWFLMVISASVATAHDHDDHDHDEEDHECCLCIAAERSTAKMLLSEPPALQPASPFVSAQLLESAQTLTHFEATPQSARSPPFLLRSA